MSPDAGHTDHAMIFPTFPPQSDLAKFRSFARTIPQTASTFALSLHHRYPSFQI